MQTNQTGWLFKAHGSISFQSRLSITVLSARASSNQYPWWGCCVQNVSFKKGKNVHFPNCKENQVNGDSTRTKKTAVLSGRKGALRCVYLVSPTVQSTLQDFFSSLLCLILFSVTFSCMNCFYPPYPFPNGPSLYFIYTIVCVSSLVINLVFRPSDTVLFLKTWCVLKG